MSKVMSTMRLGQMPRACRSCQATSSPVTFSSMTTMCRRCDCSSPNLCFTLLVVRDQKARNKELPRLWAIKSSKSQLG